MHQYEVPCSVCAKQFRSVRKTAKFCSDRCKNEQILENLKPFLVKNSARTGQSIKRSLLSLGMLSDKCEMPGCGISTWNGKTAPLEMDHINGDNRDHRLENLRILCANCHSQLPTHCWGNTNKQKEKRAHQTTEKDPFELTNADPKNKCKECNEPCWGQMCIAHYKKETIIEWPDAQKVLSLVLELGFVRTGQILGVTDNSVRKFLKRSGVEVPKMRYSGKLDNSL